MKKNTILLKDITCRTDIETLVKAFYDKVKADKTLGYIFNEIAQTNWERHLPVMSDFWENTILFTGHYEGSPMDLHKHLHKVMPLEKEHFKKWNNLFIETVDQFFIGENAMTAKQRALKISAVLEAEILKLKA